MDILHSTNNRWIGIVISGIIGLILTVIFSYYFTINKNFINHFVTINIITLIIIFCIVYYLLYKFEKNSKSLNRIHLILINSIIGAVFGLFVGVMSYEANIYLFIFGFAILSILPFVNMLTVVFWLGTTIYASYNPNILIPIFNDLLPIQLVDGSTKEITSLPLFILPLSVFLGYLIPVSITKSQVKKRLLRDEIAEQKELKNKMNEYTSKLQKWKIEGYDIKILEGKQKSGNLTSNIENFRDYELKIQKLKQLETEMQQLDIEEFNYDTRSIKRKFKNPYNLDEIESDLTSLKKRIKIKIKKLLIKTDNEIKNTIRAANKSKNPQQLKALNNLQEDFIEYSEDFVSLETSYKDYMNKIKNLYNQVIKLNVPTENSPPKKEPETPPVTQIEKLNYYELFNIRPNATQNQIKKMFKRLSLAYHPDTMEDTGVDGDQRYRKIIEAYEILKDPNKRKKYDEEIGIKK